MQCSGDPSAAPFSVEMVGSTLLPSCFSKDLGHITLRNQTRLPPATAMTPHGQCSGLRGKLGCVCQHPRENQFQYLMLPLPRGPAVPAQQARPALATAPHCCPHKPCRPGPAGPTAALSRWQRRDLLRWVSH